MTHWRRVASVNEQPHATLGRDHARDGHKRRDDGGGVASVQVLRRHFSLHRHRLERPDRDRGGRWRRASALGRREFDRISGSQQRLPGHAARER